MSKVTVNNTCSKTNRFTPIIDKCLKYPAYITNWEYQFLESIKSQIDDGKYLSNKQIKTLFKIYKQLNQKNIEHKAIIYGQQLNLK